MLHGLWCVALATAISHRKQLWNYSCLFSKLSHWKSTILCSKSYISRAPRMKLVKEEKKRWSRQETRSFLFLPFATSQEPREKKKKANEAKWLALSSFNLLDGLGLFFSSLQTPSWLIVGSPRWLLNVVERGRCWCYDMQKTKKPTQASRYVYS